MSTRSEVAPSTLEVDLVDGGIVVRYLDGREVFYHGPPEPVESSLTTPPGKTVHVLVTDEDGVEGVMTYVNDLKTDAEILESTGVGRVLIEQGERSVLFPGVSAAAEGHSVTVSVEPAVVDGRVFVFAEDEFSERAYELVTET
ncbi:hypothetical protein C479_00717 [Halovivax asiaticus JCM 14624]|uniref:Uncharacterized protein n=1 Tax=Halovivax asiaticus JCM 14624 TaxID=1227490 RepID=M0BVR3_9EURY|nr:DUF5796 family protein [Halovivax asiaticus]ELZ14207.1 hypothetical protein C479_00717 [Halovivax asiaticus JCM 14624]